MDEGLSPLAALLQVLCETVMGPKPSPLSLPVPSALRCLKCHSPRTRVKSLRFYPNGLGKIEGFSGRCRVCGGETIFTVDGILAVAASDGTAVVP